MKTFAASDAFRPEIQILGQVASAEFPRLNWKRDALLNVYIVDVVGALDKKKGWNHGYL